MWINLCKANVCLVLALLIGCSDTLTVTNYTSETGNFASPNYGATYPANSSYRWYISESVGKVGTHCLIFKSYCFVVKCQTAFAFVFALHFKFANYCSCVTNVHMYFLFLLVHCFNLRHVSCGRICKCTVQIRLGGSCWRGRYWKYERLYSATNRNSFCW